MTPPLKSAPASAPSPISQALQLPDSVFSAQDLQSVIIEVRQYAKWLSQAAVKQRVNPAHTTDADTAPYMSPAASQLLQALHTTANGTKANEPATNAALEKLLSQLEAFKAAAPTLTITLAAPATKDLKTSLVGWCRANVAPDVLVSFSFNTTLLGGMVVRYGSRIFDWSFRRQILDQRGMFPGVLRNT